MTQPLTQQHLEQYRFKPGQSGNPGGKRKGLVELRSLSQECYPQALRRLNELIDSRNEDTARWAITTVLNYVLGKPSDSMALLEGLRQRLGVEGLPTPLLAKAVDSGSSNGKTLGSEPSDGGSNPSPEAPAQPSLTALAKPQEPSPPAPPETPAATPVGGVSLGFEMTPDRADLLKRLRGDAEPCCRGWADDTYLGPSKDGHSPECRHGKPQAPPTEAPAPRLPLVQAVEGRTGQGQPEPAESLSPQGHRCLYRTAQGQCGALTEGSQWCEVHRAKLFAQLGAK